MNRYYRKKTNKGFTLVELIVVLVILAVLAAILTPALLGYIDEARSRRYFANAKTCFDAAQAMFSRQYGLNGEIKPGEALMPGTNRISTSHGNEDRDIVGSEFSKELLSLAGLPEGTPYCFMVAVGSNATGVTNVSIVDKYTIYYAFYLESENAKPWYYYNGEWSTTNPRHNDSNKIFSQQNVIQSPYPHAGLRLQYYLIAADKKITDKYPTTILSADFWKWLKAME